LIVVLETREDRVRDTALTAGQTLTGDGVLRVAATMVAPEIGVEIEVHPVVPAHDLVLSPIRTGRAVMLHGTTTSSPKLPRKTGTSFV
jgi:hypothetical protein